MVLILANNVSFLYYYMPFVVHVDFVGWLTNENHENKHSKNKIEFTVKMQLWMTEIEYRNITYQSIYLDSKIVCGYHQLNIHLFAWICNKYNTNRLLMHKLYFIFWRKGHCSSKMCVGLWGVRFLGICYIWYACKINQQFGVITYYPIIVHLWLSYSMLDSFYTT